MGQKAMLASGRDCGGGHMRLGQALRGGVLVMLLLGGTPVRAQDLPAEAAQGIDALFSDIKGDRPGYALGVVRDGRLVFAQGYGMANLDDRVPVTPRTSFHIASLSKQFTGAAVALLVLDGALSLEDPLSRFLPEAARFGPDLRVKHLVYMTSGLPEYTSLPRAGGQPWQSSFYFTRDDAIRAVLAADRLLFQPGTRWAYSNTDYMLLTRIVEIVSGQRFADFMRERVFAPLGMTATLVNDDATQVIPHRAQGYVRRSEAISKEAEKLGIVMSPGEGYARLVRNSPHFGGSGVFSTLEDLAKWDANWSRGTVGGPGFTALMQRRETFAHDKDNDAFGLVHGTALGRPTLWYSGGDIDASSHMLHLPGEGLTIFCLSNEAGGDCERRARAVLPLLLPSKP